LRNGFPVEPSAPPRTITDPAGADVAADPMMTEAL
jgi:hypothetical protein